MSLEELNPLDNEESGAKKTEQSAEVFRDQQKRAQKTQQALQKAEAKTRKKDDCLAQVIKNFLATKQSGPILPLLVRCLDKNIPAGFLVGILALVDATAKKEFDEFLTKVEPFLLTGSLQLPQRVSQNADFSVEVQQDLHAWENSLLEFSLTNPTRLLTTALSPEKKVYSSLLQLTAFVLQEFLAGQKSSVDFAVVRNCSETLLVKIFTEVQLKIKGVKQLGGHEEGE